MKLRIALACLLLAAAAGCGNGGSSSGGGGSIGPASNTFLYVSNAGNNTIAAFQVNADTGALPALPGSPFTFNGGVPARLATDSQGRLLFVADARLNSFSVYLIDRVTGALTAVGTTAMAAAAQDLATDPAANLIYLLSATQISAFRFDTSSGATTQVPGSPFSVGSGSGTAAAQRLAIDSAGGFLYLTNLTELLSYRIAGDGSLTLVNRFSQAGAALTGIAGDPAAPFLYAASPASGAGQASGVFAFATSAGTLTPLPGSPFSAGLGMRELTMDKAGKFVAAGGGLLGAGVVSFLTVTSATGQLALVPQSPFVSPPDPVQLTIDPAGHFVYSANPNLSTSSAGNVSGFSIDNRTSNLTPVVGSPFSLAAPTGVVSVRPAP